MSGLAQVPGQPPTGPQLDNRRVIAGAIDGAIVAAAGALLMVAFGGFDAVLAAIVVGWALYYFFAFESGNGQTLGKRVAHLRVVRSDGSHAGMREIAVRTALRVVDGIGFYLVGLAVMMATGKRRQRLGDLAAGTVVTEADAPPGEDEPVVEAAAEPEAPTALLEPEQPVVAPEPEPEPPTAPLAPEAIEPEVEPEPAHIEPEPVAADPEPAPVAPEPEPEPEPAVPEPTTESEPAEPQATEESDSEADEGAEDEDSDERPRLHIVTNPIELIMAEQQAADEQRGDSPDPPEPPGDAGGSA